jgi:lipopolysaccharide/colanic/teichoic acid biosynthesis glycosyltransferase
MTERRARQYMFRSMRAGAVAETGTVWASQDDPRVTAFGRTARKLASTRSPSNPSSQ